MAMPRTPRELADRMAARKRRDDDGFIRETFAQPREAARQTAAAFFAKFPKQAYMTEVERWRLLENGDVEFTMRRLRSAD
jgi:hypothetical protein